MFKERESNGKKRNLNGLKKGEKNPADEGDKGQK